MSNTSANEAMKELTILLMYLSRRPETRHCAYGDYPVYSSEFNRNRDISIYSRWQASSRFRPNNS